MPTASDTQQVRAQGSALGNHLYRSRANKVLGGVGGGLGEYFGVDPVWFRLAFVLLALGGGSGILIYLAMWIIVPERPAGDEIPIGEHGRVSGAMVVGMVFIIVGTIALVNTIAPSLGQYFWPIVFVGGGVALVLGGLNRDTSG